MISTSWIEKRRLHWNRLEQLVASSGRGSVSSLSPGDLQELALLYRQIASDLASVREDPTSSNLALYLNQLLSRAHNLIYMGKKSQRRGVYHFYRNVYPAIFRRTFADTSAAFLLFLFAALAGALLTISDPAFSRSLLGPAMMEHIDQRKMWTDSVVAIKPVASSGIMTNNITVSLTTFALGITAGLGTAYMLIFNGILIGTVGAACWQAGMSLSLWSFVAPHGVLELPAIFIAGGAGFRIARGLLFPGILPRGESLIREGRMGMKLFFGAFPMLVIAGMIEGFLSPSTLPASLKFLVAAALFTLLALYLMRDRDVNYLEEEEDPYEAARPLKSGSDPLPSSTGSR
jgi:uncharacterized membrane protein SpoIIM required for sporulation